MYRRSYGRSRGDVQSFSTSVASAELPHLVMHFFWVDEPRDLE
jgi:hypothetical protein